MNQLQLLQDLVVVVVVPKTDLLTASRIGIYSGGRSALMIGMKTARVECARVSTHLISEDLRQQEFNVARDYASELCLTHHFGETALREIKGDRSSGAFWSEGT